MEIYITYILFIVGLLMIIKGSDWFVDSAVWGAKVSGIPEAVIGATIVSICTTLPETIVAATASLEGETNMAVGNALGSIAANTGLILAIMFLFSKQTTKLSKAYLTNGSFLISVLLLSWGIGLHWKKFSKLAGVLFIVLFVFFLYKNFRKAQEIMPSQLINAGQEGRVEEQKIKKSTRVEIGKNILVFIAGLIFVILGAQLVVKRGILIAESLGIPTIVIALVFTSLGTSLPELITAVSAIRKNAIELGMGNVIGANVLNLLQVIGVSALITPIDLTLDKSLLYFQFPVNLAFCSIAVFLNQKGTRNAQKLSGFLLFFLYLAFLLVNILRENTPFIGNLIF